MAQAGPGRAEDALPDRLRFTRTTATDDKAIAEFEKARNLDPRLAAPHFQLYGLYREQEKQAEATRELAAFQEIKKQQDASGDSEDMEWCVYAEVYDPIDAPPPSPPPAPVYNATKIAGGFDAATAGLTALAFEGGARPSLLAWSAQSVRLYRYGRTPVANTGLEGLKDVVFIAPGDFDNDGLPDLCVITRQGASLYHNVKGQFRKQADLATGSFNKAVWMDFDHDYDEDLVLLGPDSRLFRNNGSAGFSDETRRFPFVAGSALDAVPFDLDPDTPGFDLVVSYRNRAGVLYHDRLGGSYEAIPIDALPAGAHALAARDVNRDGRTDLMVSAPENLLLLNQGGKLQPSSPAPASAGANSLLADFDGNGRLARARIEKDGSLYVDRDSVASYGNWIEIALEGVKNPKIPLNTKVEIKAGSSYEKATYQGVPASLPLGRPHADRYRADHVAERHDPERNGPGGESRGGHQRSAAPGGLVPHDLHLERQRASSSSRTCWAWRRWAQARATAITSRWITMSTSRSPARRCSRATAHYEVRLTEELREVSYIDQIKLIALDHPAGIDVITNEKFKSPPFPEFRLFGAERKIYPVERARGELRPVQAPRRARLCSTRRSSLSRYVPPRLGRRRRTASPGSGFRPAARDNRAALVLNGWVDWADGSTFLAADAGQRRT